MNFNRASIVLSALCAQQALAQQTFQPDQKQAPQPVTYKVLGCYKDAENYTDRDLKHKLSDDASPMSCFAMAAKQGYKYAGMQYGRECFADNQYGTYGKADAAECDMPCDHDKSLNCGGNWRNTIYEVSGPLGKAKTGTNAGGWMVLEPWITPSLFYRFLGKTQEEGVGMDSYSLCEALGPVEGNKLMRAHWDSFYTEQDIKNLADRGVEWLRFPIGDWTLEPYGPYVGCMDGAKDKVDWMFDMCDKYNIKILLDVHAMKGSQNGFDNSGMTNKVIWTNSTHFSHWGNAEANWQGPWNREANKYDYISLDNLNRSVEVARQFIARWGSHKAFGAFEPVNEPWWNSDMPSLKGFYRKVRSIVQELAPQAYFVFHDAFAYNAGLWNDLFADDDHDKVALDHHQYQAWTNNMNTTKQFCDDYEQNAAYADQIKYEVWIGEWSLATDVCAHWLGGFNDGNTDPQFECKRVPCPETYLPAEVAVDFDRTADMLGPFGTANNLKDVTIQKGTCSTDSDFFSKDQVRTIAKCALASWDRHVEATFLWTAHNEIEEKWDYVKAWDNGWIDKPLADDVEVVITE